MNIYKIHISWQGYDTYDGHIIVANVKKEVIKLAQSINADEGEYIWNNASVKKIGKYNGRNKKPFILLSSFNAG